VKAKILQLISFYTALKREMRSGFKS